MHALQVEPSLHHQQYTGNEILDISIAQTTDTSVGNDKWPENIQVLAQHILFRIDTEDRCNTLTFSSSQLLRHTGELKYLNKILHTYSNHRIKPIAAADLPVKYKKREATAEFEIINIAQENVLNEATAEALGLIVCLHSLWSCTDDTEEEVPAELESFPDLVCTTGTLPGTYTIKIDPEAKGVVHPVHHQPAAQKTKIVEKLNEMVENGYITKVEEPPIGSVLWWQYYAITKSESA